MVLNFADLEINFQWKWLFRPCQRDGMKVEDYYSQFCDWRQEMISLSFPVEEEDYIAGFIENLRWDIRWRLSKYKCSQYTLTNAFYNAKFEETSLMIEENIKQIRADIVFDDMPSRTPVSKSSEESIEINRQSESYAEYLEEKVAEQYAHKLFEDMPRSPSIEQKEENVEADRAGDGNRLSNMFLPKSFLKDEESGLILGDKDESGLQVLSIYCAHMAPKWNNILEMRPKQSDDKSVEVYYDLFYSWKKKLDAVNYIGGEESYIDDFIYGLEIKLGMRVWGYKWKPRTLYGAFRRAEIEETMMKNDADMVLEKRPQLNSSDIQSVENVSDGYINVVLDASGLVSDWFRSYLPVESISQGDQSQVDVLKDSACNVSDERVNPNPSYLQLTRQCVETAVTEYVEQILNDGVGKIPVMKTECLKVACSLFDESSSQFSAEQIIGSEGLSKWEPSMVGFKYAAVKKMFDGTTLLMFDTGISSCRLKYRNSINSSEIPSHSVVDLWLGKVVFLFDPGGNYFAFGTWNLRNTLSINWGRPFDGTNCHIYDIVELVVSGFRRKEFIEIISLGRRILIGPAATYIWNFSLKGPAAKNHSSYDISALKAINGFPVKKTNTGRFDPFDEFRHTHVFLEMLVDYTIFTLLIPIYSAPNGRPLYDVVMSLSLFVDRILWLVASTKIHDTSQAMWKVMTLYMLCLNVFLQRGHLHEIICLTFSIVIKRIRGMEFLQSTFIMYYFCGVCENEFPCLWKLNSLSVVVRMSSQNAIFLYILGDKDDFGGVERTRLGMVITRSIKYDESEDELATKMAMLNGGVASVRFCFIDLHGIYYGAVENLKWYEERKLQGENVAALRMWLQLIKEDFGVCRFVFGAHLWIMSSVKADCLLLETMLEPLMFKHSNGGMMFIFHTSEISNHLNTRNSINLLYPDWGEDITEAAQARHEWGSSNQNLNSFALDSIPLRTSLFRLAAAIMLAVGLLCPAQQWNFSYGYDGAKVKILVWDPGIFGSSVSFHHLEDKAVF